jgi:hypothetical protein
MIHVVTIAHSYLDDVHDHSLQTRALYRASDFATVANPTGSSSTYYEHCAMCADRNPTLQHADRQMHAALRRGSSHTHFPELGEVGTDHNLQKAELIPLARPHYRCANRRAGNITGHWLLRSMCRLATPCSRGLLERF